MPQTTPAQAPSVYQVLPMTDLSGGLDLRRSPSLVAPNRARRLQNWSLAEPGALNVFPGWKPFTTGSRGNNRGQGGQRVYLAAATFTLEAYQGSVYKPADDGTPGSSVLAGLSATNQIYFPYDRDIVAVFDGANVPQKSQNGTTWTQDGINKPASAPTVAAVAGGSLIDTHVYEFSYSHQNDSLTIEGNESGTVQGTAAGANLTLRVGVTASADPQVTSINLYVRDSTAGELVRRFYANYPNTTTTHDVTSNTWSAGTEAPTDHNVAPVMSFGVVWKNRWWGVDATTGNRLHFTQIFQAQSWPTLFYLDMPFERGDSIAAIQPQGDTLVICGQSKIFVILGHTSLDFEVRPALAVQEGALGPRCVEALESGILHAGASGVYLFDGASDRLLSYDIDPAWQDLLANASPADLARIAMVYHQKRKELRIALPRLYPYSTAGEFVLDLNRTRISQEPAWFCTDRTVGGYVHWNGNESTTGNRGRLFSWSNTIGQLFEEATGTAANGTNVTTDYLGPTLVSGNNQARFIDLAGEYQPNAGTFVIEPFVDDVSQGVQTVDIGSTLPVYGTATYGSSTYAGAGRKRWPAKMLPLGADGQSLTVAAKYTGQSAFRWFSYYAGLLPEGSPRGI
jgi:hypothetical protein